MPVSPTVTAAFAALKRQDFATARALMSGADMAAFDPPHFLIKGLSELALHDWAAAQATFAVATARFPDDALFWLNRGIAEENLEQTEAAIASHEHCLKLNPAQGEACGNLANLYRQMKRFALSEKMARRALQLGAARGDALNSLGLALGKQGRHEEADRVFAEAMREPTANPFVIANRANLAIDRLRFDAAWPLFAQARAIADKPVFRRDEGMARLLSGDDARGWALYESRLELPHALRLRPPCPRWQGEDLRGKKLLVLAEQGFGDVIHFCRYQQFLHEAALVWAVPKNLVRLLAANLRGAVLYENDPLPACDYYAPMLSLPWLTRARIPHAQLAETKTGPFPGYLTAPALPLLPPGRHTRKIGLVWAGSRTHERDHERSLPLALFAAIVRNTDADFYAPFTGAALGDIQDVPITRLDSLITDFADTAALIAQMHCLITVDTAAAHLAGALGVKTFLLLPYCPDWRWSAQGDTTPWYPSLTLLRQPRYGEWPAVVDLLKRCL